MTVPSSDLSLLSDNGTVTVTADISDAAGNPSVQATSSFDTDFTAPSITISALSDGAIMNAAEQSTDLTVSGTSDAPDGTTVTVQIARADGTVDVSGTATVTGGGWNYTAASLDLAGLQDNESYSVTASVADAAGNSSSASDGFTTDFSAPSITLDPVPTGAVLDVIERNSDLAVSGTTTAEDGQTVSVTLGGQTFTAVVSSGTWSATVLSGDLAALADGTAFTLTAMVDDAAGNSAPAATTTLTTDFRPVLTLNDVGTNGAVSLSDAQNSRLTISGSSHGLAVESSPHLAKSDARFAAANAGQDAAKGAFLPQVFLGLNARSERVVSDAADFSPYLRVSQLVYDGGAAAGDLAAARARIFESQGDRLQTASATALAAIETYVTVLDRRKIQDLTARNVEVHQQLVQQISQRAASGAGSKGDVLTARSRMVDAQTRFADAKTRTARAEARFVEIYGTAPGVLAPAIPAPLLSRSDAQIVEASPQIRRADAAVVAAKAELSAALACRQPDERLAAFANRDDSRDANYGVDLAVNYEIDSTGTRRAAIAVAEAQVRDVEFSRESLSREKSRELGFIRSDHKAGAERLQAARQAAQANADSIKAAQAQFLIGRRTLIEILDAQRDYVNAQERLILAEQNYFLTNYAALSLTGDILDLLGVTLNNRIGQP